MQPVYFFNEKKQKPNSNQSKISDPMRNRINYLKLGRKSADLDRNFAIFTVKKP